MGLLLSKFLVGKFCSSEHLLDEYILTTLIQHLLALSAEVF